jgi:hypothetical protein
MFNSVVSMRELELELESVQLLPRRETLCVMKLHAGHGHGYDNGYGNGDNGNGDGGCGDGDNGCGDNYGYDNGCGDNGYDNGCGDNYGYDDGCGDNYDYGCN